MIASSGQPIPIEVTFETGLLFVAMKVFDVTLGFPGSQVGSAISMTEFDDGAYGASFVGDPNKNYVVSKAVYTDGTYTVRDSNFASGSQSVQCVAIGSVDVQSIVDGVWDELLSNHSISGSMASVLNRLKVSDCPIVANVESSDIVAIVTDVLDVNC